MRGGLGAQARRRRALADRQGHPIHLKGVAVLGGAESSPFGAEFGLQLHAARVMLQPTRGEFVIQLLPPYAACGRRAMWVARAACCRRRTSPTSAASERLPAA